MKSVFVLVTAALAAFASLRAQDPKPPPPASGGQQTPPASGAQQTPPPATGAQQQPPAGPGAARTAEQAPAGEQAAAKFSNEQLEQIAAPIALHPDALLAHIFMASTYPLEIVECERWLTKNSKLKDKALEDALKPQEWDDSVKSLCTFPTVLKQLSDNLDWTQDLGDAVLGQKKELMEAVQRMRHKALDAGNLKTSEQQKVTSEGDVIIIQSASPEVIYVPTYSPTVVYGGWSYPYYYYPPMYAPYPPGAGFVSFAFGVAVGGAIWGNCNWGHTDIDIDIDRNTEFNRNVNREPRSGDRASNRAGNSATNRAGSGTSQFKHDPSHRKGVNYKSQDVANRMGASAGTNRVSRDQARGFDRGGASASTRPSTGASRPSSGTSQRPSASPSTRSGSSSSARPSTTPSRSSSSSSRSSAMSGSRNAGLERSASSRGASSRSSGASRSGGSRGGGGGRRR